MMVSTRFFVRSADYVDVYKIDLITHTLGDLCGANRIGAWGGVAKVFRLTLMVKC